MTTDGQYIYRLDPELEDVAYFPNIVHSTIPYSIKQLVAHEVEVEKMRRKEPSTGRELSTNKSISKESDSVKQNKQKEAAKLPENVPNHLQKLKAKDIQVKERVPVDFFGRKIEKPINTNRTSTMGNVSEKGANKGELVFSDVWFKFKEGYNNAVRRKIRVKDLA